MNWSAVDLSILLPAFLAGVLVLATHVPLGVQVLKKGIVFIDLAIAQIAGLGVIVVSLCRVDAARQSREQRCQHRRDNQVDDHGRDADPDRGRRVNADV